MSYLSLSLAPPPPHPPSLSLKGSVHTRLPCACSHTHLPSRRVRVDAGGGGGAGCSGDKVNVSFPPCRSALPRRHNRSSLKDPFPLSPPPPLPHGSPSCGQGESHSPPRASAFMSWCDRSLCGIWRWLIDLFTLLAAKSTAELFPLEHNSR